MKTWPKPRLCESAGVWTEGEYPDGAMADAGDEGSRYLPASDGNWVLIEGSFSVKGGRAESGVEIPEGRTGGSAGAGLPL